MLHELKEFRDLVELGDSHRPGRGLPQPPDEEEITRCIQILLARQCLYPRMQSVRGSYRVLATPEYQGFFRKYFAAMGLELVHDLRSGMIALKMRADTRRYDWQAARLKKDETLVLFVLRLAYEEGFQNNSMSEHGEVDISTDDLMEKFEVVAGLEIAEGRLTEILTALRKKGVVDLGDHDPVERVRPLTILPGIEIAVPEAYIEQVRAWAEGLAEPGADDSPEAENA